MKSRILFLFLLLLFACKPSHKPEAMNIRGFVDTVGFAHLGWQMDSIAARIERSDADTFGSHCHNGNPLRLAISPHDDYTYAGPLYFSLLKDVHAHTLILFGVAHKARALGIEGKMVFGNYKKWKEPYGEVAVSAMQNNILKSLDTSLYLISDTLQRVEHSLEALIPFLQYFNPGLEIIPILVPAMPFEKMQQAATALASAINTEAGKRNLNWGKDFALVISTDAVHYGDEDWGGKNYAPFGADTLGYWLAVDHEKEIMRNCFTGQLTPEKARKFSEYTVDSKDYREYKWTWCGRYAVPFGMLTAWNLAGLQHTTLGGCIYGYATSIDHPHLPVSDLHMGITAPAKLRHWVGYGAAGYR